MKLFALIQLLERAEWRRSPVAALHESRPRLPQLFHAKAAKHLSILKCQTDAECAVEPTHDPSLPVSDRGIEPKEACDPARAEGNQNSRRCSHNDEDQDQDQKLRRNGASFRRDELRQERQKENG